MTAGISRPILDRAFLKTRSELRGLAQVLMRSERNGHTLQPTAVVHETYLRLLRSPPRRNIVLPRRREWTTNSPRSTSSSRKRAAVGRVRRNWS